MYVVKVEPGTDFAPIMVDVCHKGILIETLRLWDS